MTIFIVDDEPLIHRLFEHVLTVEGYEIIGHAYDGMEALRIYRSLILSYRKPDVIIMDHLMPKKDGIETAAEIFDIDSSAKILFVSVDEGARERALALGAIDFIKKPFEVSEVLNVLENLRRKKDLTK
ncbi:MAG: two-component system response regulator [bacterium (Candidatus Stahlbacteria) CG23_combo_of_CG06-09_8_20_14_all_40_9]|nr:MAG: two-component system response regulator [bacterium (Candidatus Stahlbacteria) CG23_combo_of_CG06-09_8_20_14_all_40_9]